MTSYGERFLGEEAMGLSGRERRRRRSAQFNELGRQAAQAIELHLDITQEQPPQEPAEQGEA